MFSFDNKVRYGSIIALLLLLTSATNVRAQRDIPQGVFIGDDLLILLEQDRNITDVMPHLEALQLTQPRQLSLGATREFYKLRFPDSIIQQRNEREIKQLLTAVRKLPGIEHAEPNYLFYGALIDAMFTPDPYFIPSYPNGQWSLHSQYPTSVKADDAWDLSMGEGNRIVILDSGIEESHPDLPSLSSVAKDYVDHENHTQNPLN